MSALCSPEAFIDPRWRLVYGVAFALRTGNAPIPVCLESVNDFIAFHGQDRQFQHALTRPAPSLGSAGRGLPTIRLAYSELGAAYCLGELEAFGSNAKPPALAPLWPMAASNSAPARAELGALHAGNGAFDFAPYDARRFDMTRLHVKPTTVFSLCDQAIATPGNLVAMYAQAKAGKSAVVSAMIAAAINLIDEPGDYLGFAAAPNDSGKALLHLRHRAITLRS